MQRLQRVGLRSSHSIGLRYSIKRRSLGGEHRIWVKVTLGMLSRFFMGASYRPGLLTLKGNGNDMISILVGHVHGGWCIIGG